MNNQNTGLENLGNLDNNGNNLNDQINIPQNNNLNDQINIPQNNNLDNQMNIPQNNNLNINIPINNNVNFNKETNNFSNNMINASEDNNLGRPEFHPMNEYHHNVESSIEKESFLKKLDYKKILIIGGIIVFIIVGVIVGKNIFKNKKTSSEDILASNSFFLSNNNNSAIFDKNGNQLTDFIFQSGPDKFINGAALVENDNDEKGLVSESGKMLIEFGKCKYLFRYGSVFTCTTAESNDILYDSNGKILLETDYLDGFDEVNKYEYSVISDKKNMMVYNYKGEKITFFPVNDSLSLFNNKPLIKGIDNYVSINYDGKSYIIDSDSKLLFTLDEPYCVSSVSEDKKQFIISSCNYEDYRKPKTFKVVKDGKVAYSVTMDSIDKYLEFEGNAVVNNDNEYYDNNGNSNKQIEGWYDDKNYVLKSGDEKYDLYENNKLKATVNCEKLYSRGYQSSKIYLFNDCNNTYDYFFYKNDGTLLNEQKYEFASSFDENNIAIVAHEAKKYFMIDSNGKQISKEYSSISDNYKGYGVYTAINDDTKVCLDKDGNELVSGDGIRIENKKFAVVTRGNKYELYDYVNKKSIITLDADPILKDNYFEIDSSNKIQYYSYETGKKFYEINN